MSHPFEGAWCQARGTREQASGLRASDKNSRLHPLQHDLQGADQYDGDLLQ